MFLHQDLVVWFSAKERSCDPNGASERGAVTGCDSHKNEIPHRRVVCFFIAPHEPDCSVVDLQAHT